MEEHFILRVPPAVAEKLDALLGEKQATEDDAIDLSFKDGRSGTFKIGKEEFDISLMDLPAVVESYKTYDESVLIKAADIGQMIMVRDHGEPPPESAEHKDGLTAPMKDARKKRFRREPELNPDYVHQVETDLLNIMAGGTARNVEMEVVEQEEEDIEEPEPAAAPQPVTVPEPPPATTNDDKAADDDDDSSDEETVYYEDSEDEY